MRGRILTALAVVALPLLVSACSQTSADLGVKSMVAPKGHGYSAREKECLMRAMFFESNRSSRDGLVSVGTVVMNRVRSGKWGNTICEVVGAPRQFAPGVMTRPMNSKALPDVEEAAEAVLKGERAAKVKNSMYFHTAGLKFPYRNMHYTVVAGGNAFYERRNRNGDPVVLPPERAPGQPPVMIASAELAGTPPELKGSPVAANTPTVASDASVTAVAASAATPAVPAASAVSANGQPAVATAPSSAATQAAPVLVADTNPAVKKARPIMSSRGDGGSVAVARTPRQPGVSEQPVTVSMAMNGATPSSATSEAVPFANADTSAEAASSAGDPLLPAVTEAIPVPARQVAAVAPADGLSAGDPGTPAAETDTTAMSFNVEQSDADAIGAMLVSEERPVMGFN